MATIQAISCDECGIQKKDANHWFSVRVVTDPGFPSETLLLGHANLGLTANLIADLCGESCLHRFIDRKLKLGAHRPAVQQGE